MKRKFQNDGHGKDNIIQNTFTAYVEKALSNNRIKYIQKQARHSEIELYGEMEDIVDNEQIGSVKEDMIDSIFGSELDSLENLALFSALKGLDEKDLAIVKMHVIYEYSYKRIAVVMGMTLTAVRSRYSRAIKLIRRRMEDSK